MVWICHFNCKFSAGYDSIKVYFIKKNLNTKKIRKFKKMHVFLHINALSKVWAQPGSISRLPGNEFNPKVRRHWIFFLIMYKGGLFNNFAIKIKIFDRALFAKIALKVAKNSNLELSRKLWELRKKYLRPKLFPSKSAIIWHFSTFLLRYQNRQKYTFFKPTYFPR